MAKTRPDFVDVQLSAAGVAAAGSGGSIRIATQHFDYTFSDGAPTNVLVYEWNSVLANETINGQKILELTPAVVVQVPEGAAPADELAAVKQEEAALDAEIAPQSQPQPADSSAGAAKPAKGSK